MPTKFTTEPPKPSDASQLLPEFGRAGDVQRLFGIKRGTLYNLVSDGKVRSVLLRVRGEKSGCRLFSIDSVRKLIHAQMDGQ
jgi:hypothetical protein